MAMYELVRFSRVRIVTRSHPVDERGSWLVESDGVVVLHELEAYSALRGAEAKT